MESASADDRTVTHHRDAAGLFYQADDGFDYGGMRGDTFFRGQAEKQVGFDKNTHAFVQEAVDAAQQFEGTAYRSVGAVVRIGFNQGDGSFHSIIESYKKGGSEMPNRLEVFFMYLAKTPDTT